MDSSIPEQIAPEIIAAIIAAIEQYAGTGRGGFTVRTVRRVDLWNSAAVVEK